MLYDISSQTHSDTHANISRERERSNFHFQCIRRTLVPYDTLGKAKKKQAHTQSVQSVTATVVSLACVLHY